MIGRQRHTTFWRDVAVVVGLLILLLGAVGWRGSASRSLALTMRDADPFVAQMHGWEELPDQSRTYRWTAGDSWLRLPNPGGLTMLTIDLAGNPTGAVPAHLTFDRATLNVIVPQAFRRYMLLVPPSPNHMHAIGFRSPTLATPERNIGLVLSDTRISGGSRMPDQIVGLLALVLAIGYGLLRAIGWRRWIAAPFGAVVSVGFLGWYLAAGWRTGLVDLSLLIVSEAILIVGVSAQPWLSRNRRLLACGTAVVLNALIFGSLYYLAPQHRTTLFAEDRIVEMLTALWFAWSFALGSVLLVVFRPRYALLHAIVPLLGGVCFLDEISFGQRLIGWNMPNWHDVELDGIHDVLSLMLKILQHSESMALRATVVVLLITAAGCTCWLLKQIFQNISDLRRNFAPLIFIALSVSALAAAMLIDLEFSTSAVLTVLIEELAEMSAALCLVFAAAAIPQSQPKLQANPATHAPSTLTHQPFVRSQR